MNFIKKVNNMNYTFKTKNVCAMEISFDLEGDVVTHVKFKGGCNGNLKAISKLVDGFSVDKIYTILSGNTCNGKSTSCADQLAIAVKNAYDLQRQ